MDPQYDFLEGGKLAVNGATAAPNVTQDNTIEAAVRIAVPIAANINFMVSALTSLSLANAIYFNSFAVGSIESEINTP